MAWNSNGAKRCPKNCPNRAPGCHNVATCESWARQVEEHKKKLEARRAAMPLRRMSWEAMAAAEKGAK